MPYRLLLLFAAVSLYLFVQKVVFRRRLGWKVEDHELTSIASWMAGPARDERAGE